MNISLGKKAKKSLTFEQYKKQFNDYYVKRGAKKFDEMQADWERETGKKVSDVQEDSQEPKKSKRKQDSPASVQE